MELVLPTTVDLFPASSKFRPGLSPPIITSKPFFPKGKRNDKLVPCRTCCSSRTTRNHDGRNNESLSSSSCSSDAAAVLEPLGLERTHWVVVMEKPKSGVSSKSDAIDHFVRVLSKVLGSERDSQMCIYDVLWESHFGFCCRISEEESRMLAGVSGVLSVQLDIKFESENKDYEVKIIMDKISKRSKGYGFIEYTSEEAAAAALKEMNGKIINGWMIVVDVAKTNPPRYGGYGRR
ncbi:Multiple organellar RNA editing factor 5 [Nymphaea thermarum]|nr:Multiple organellar RNA editing factor 5 [Nymphaea thermarum]